MPNKIPVVPGILARSGSTEATKPYTKFFVISMVLIAFRRFQEFLMNKFKRSLNLNFDKKATLEKLKSLLTADGSLNGEKHFFDLANDIRKFGLTFEDLGSIGLRPVRLFKPLTKNLPNTDENELYFLCLSLKYLSKNLKEENNPIKQDKIANWITIHCGRSLVKNELIEILSARFEKLYVDEDQREEQEDLIEGTQGLNEDEKAYLMSKLKGGTVDKRKQETECTESMIVRKVKENQKIVSKNMQTDRVLRKTKNSEEENFKFLNLRDSMKNRNRSANNTTAVESLERPDEIAGSDQSMFRGTWSEIMNLYSLVSNGQELKSNDKNQYLPDKFFGEHSLPSYDYFPFWNGDTKKLYSFLINRMCASLYSNITRKQQLNDKAIDGLMKCIVNFEGLLSLLDMNEEYAEMIVDQIIKEYWYLKTVTRPKIIADFIQKVTSLTTEEYLKNGVFIDSYQVRKTSYNLVELEKIIREQIYSLRLDAIKALWNCAIRDKTNVLVKNRVKTITENAKRKDEDDKVFLEYISKLMKVAESLNDFDYKDAFEIHLNGLNDTERLDDHFRYLDDQARDKNRSEELFTDQVIAELIGHVRQDSHYNIIQKLGVLEIINVCLEHEGTKNLNETNLQQLLEFCHQSDETGPINAALTLILLSTDKYRRFSPGILKQLFVFFDHVNGNEEMTSFLVFILSRVYCADDEASKNLYMKNQNFVESVSTKLHCDHIVRLNENDDDLKRIEFYEPLEQNAYYDPSNKISLLSAKIISRSIENKVNLSRLTIDNLLSVLRFSDEQDKQTIIVASKCLFGLTEYMSLESGILNELRDLINSPIYDASVYIHTTYLKECVKVASDCHNSVSLANISELYVDESLVLNQHDYEPEINSDLFKILLCEAKKQQFNDSDIFVLFNELLISNSKYAPQVLEILAAYSQKYLVPKATIDILERLLSDPSYFDEALLVLKSYILIGGTSITKVTLDVFVDYLISSSNSRLRFDSFKLLERVSQSKELPYDIFCVLELVTAAYALKFRPGDKISIIKFVRSLTDKGIYLPVDTKLALEKEIACTEVLEIFASISRMKQIIEPNLLIALIKLFDPLNTAATNNNKILINIFTNTTKNNQSLSGLRKKLEEAFHLEDLEESVLPLFIYLAQKGKKLSNYVNNKLLDRLDFEENPVQKQELMSSLGSIIVAQKSKIRHYLPKINRILEKEIMSDNLNIQKSCIAAIEKMVMVSKQLDNGLLEKLTAVGTDMKCEKGLRSEISYVFDSIEDSCNPLIEKMRYREKIKLANLSGTSHRDILDELRQYTDSELLVQNYKQLKKVIDNGDGKLQREALNMLLTYKYKCQMTDELLESIAILFESTMSPKLKDLCLKLFKMIVESGKILTVKAREVLNRAENISKDQNLLQSIVFHEIKQDFQFENQILKDLIKLIKESPKVDDIKNLADLIKLIVKENSIDYFQNKSFVLLVEKCLLKKKALEEALPCYCRIIKEKKYCAVEECLQELVEHFKNNSQELANLESRLFESMHYANQCTQLPDICMKLAVDNLFNSDEIVRRYSFGILRTSKDKNQHEEYTSIFTDLCNQIMEDLAMNMKIEIRNSEDYMDLLEIIMSIKFLDAEVFKEGQKDIWKRELLVPSIFEGSPKDQNNFYTFWSDIVDELKLNHHESCKILSLIQKSTFDKCSQIFELTHMLIEMSFDDIIRMLTIYSPKPYESFKQDWCTSKVVQGFWSNKNRIDPKYSRKLAERLCSLFDVFFISRLFQCFKSIDNPSAFDELIDFCSKAKREEKLDLSDMWSIENAQLKDVTVFIKANQLCKSSRIKPENETEQKSFLQIYKTLNHAGWDLAQLDQLVAAFNPTETIRQFKNLLHFLRTIHIYRLSSSNFQRVEHILANTVSFHEMIQKLNQLIIENHFQLEGKVKDLDELTIELKKINTTDNELMSYIEAGSLDIRKHIYEEQEDKKNWTKEQISLWANEVKEGKEFTDNEAIAIIRRANFLVTGYELTETQILSSLIALSGRGNPKGKLLQIATGEGKSTIICILAIINALRGKHVDVITSSPVLAQRDAKQKAKLYHMFNLTCSENSDKRVYIKGGKDCYKADIVYGEMTQFQFDMLRDNYSKLGTLCGRTIQMAIVDEVDSMLIDDGSKIARLSRTVPGMDHFQILYVIIWQRLLDIKERLIMFNNTMYFVSGRIGFEDGKICLEYADNNDDIRKILDLEHYLLNNNDDEVMQVAEKVGDDIDEYVCKKLETYLDGQIQGKRIYIPNNFQDFVQKQRSKWISNAVEALNYQENVHYVVQNGEIKPVDYFSTGIVQSSTSWSNGLHQFLQLKHNLKMTSETLTTNFLSNIGFINKYEKVCGVTGTLGSDAARSVFREIYKVDLINIPQRHQKQYLELEHVVAQGSVDWLKEITSNIMLEIQKDRGILVICQTIKHANRISEMLTQKLQSSAVKLYTINDSGQEKNAEKISPGQVIIATNLAGRGTDIQADEIKATGGLHVILTFLPSNERVEDQAFGRTARQGKRGTGIMILNAHNLMVHDENNMTSLKDERDKTESNQLEEFKKKELKLILVKDKLFDTFCTFLHDKIRLPIRKNHQSYTEKLKSLVTDAQPTTYEVCALAAIEEQWAGFLSKLDEGTIKCEDAEKECSKVIGWLQNDFILDKFIKNPYYCIQIANGILESDWSLDDKSRAEKALKYFNKAIELEGQKKDEQQISNTEQRNREAEMMSKRDDESACSYGAAHLGVAWCSILLREENYKDNALSSFKTAMKCLSNEKCILTVSQLLLKQKQAGFDNSDLCNQLIAKATILGSYLRGIETCMDVIKRSKRMIDIVAVKKHNENDTILETIGYLYDQERGEENKNSVKNQNLKLKDNLSYSLTFNHLTTRKECFIIDQAIKTLNNAFDKSLVKRTGMLSFSEAFRKSKCLDVETYSDVRINLKSIDLAKINKDIFNNGDAKNIFASSSLVHINVEFNNLNHNDVTDKLSSIEAMSYELKIVLNKSDLLKVIEKNPTLKFGKLEVTKEENEKNVQNVCKFKRVKREELLRRVGNLKTDQSMWTVTFENLTHDIAKKIVESCPKIALFAVSFVDISNFHGNPALTNGKVNLSFDKLKQNIAEELVQMLRKMNIEFSLEFQNLSDKEVRHILQNASLEQEDIKILKKTKIRDLYHKGKSPVLELNDFASRGIVYIIEMMEKKFVPWKSVCVVASLGVGQVLLGEILMYTGIFSQAGIGLVTEGMVDIYLAYRVYSNQEFQWNDYCRQKAISLVISIASTGYSNLKDGAKGLQALGAGAGTELLEQGATQLIHNKGFVTRSLESSLHGIKTGMNVKSMALHMIGLKIPEQMAKVALDVGIQYLYEFGFDSVKQTICEFIEPRVQESFSKRTELRQFLYKRLAIDSILDSNQFQHRFEQMIAETINCQHDTRLFDKIAVPLIKDIFRNGNKWGKFALIIGACIYKFANIFQELSNKVGENLENKLREADNNLTMSQVLHRYLKIQEERTEVIAGKLKVICNFENNTNFLISQNVEGIEDLKNRMDEFSNQWNQNREAVLNELGSDVNDKTMVDAVGKSINFVKKYIDIHLDSSLLCGTITLLSNQIAEQLIKILNAEMLQPISNLVVSEGFKYLENTFLDPSFSETKKYNDINKTVEVQQAEVTNQIESRREDFSKGFSAENRTRNTQTDTTNKVSVIDWLQNLKPKIRVEGVFKIEMLPN